MKQKPSRHFCLIAWRLLYRVDVRKTIDRTDEIAMCVHGRLPVAEWERQKALFPRVWQKLLDKRARRLTWFTEYGEIPDGWCPPDPNDRRSTNRPIRAYLARRFMTEDGIFLCTLGGRRGPSEAVIERVLRWRNQP